MIDNFDLKKFISDKQLLNEVEDNKGIRLNTTTDSTKVTGAVNPNSKQQFIPKKQSFYLLGPNQLNILKRWDANDKLDVPGAKIIGDSLYINVLMIPELEGKRGRGGKYNVRDEIKASYGKDKGNEAMEVLKAINYIIINSPNKSIKAEDSEYKMIDGKGTWKGYAIKAAPSKEIDENNIINFKNNNDMNDNFDLKEYIGSKRLLTENFEPTAESKELNEMSPDVLIGMGLAPSAGAAAVLASLIGSGVLTSLENGSLGEKGQEFAKKFKQLTKTKSDTEDLNEEDESDDEEIDDSKYYKDDDEDIELDDMSDLDDYELPDSLAWEDDY